jgi:hypothetical protein
VWDIALRFRRLLPQSLVTLCRRVSHVAFMDGGMPAWPFETVAE